MTLTVEALKAVQPGDKLLAGNAVHLRCNADGSLTVTLRVKRDGKQKDIKAGVVVPPFNKTTPAKIRSLAEAMRGNKADKVLAQREADKAPAQDSDAPAKLKPGATLSDVWDSYRADVVKNKRWTARNLATNDHRVNLHLSKWAMWDKPVADLDHNAVVQHLAKLAGTPAQLVKVRGLLSLMLGKAKRAKLITDADIIKDARDEMRETMPMQSRGRKHHALLEIEPLRKLYKTIDALSGSVHVRNALKLQALTAQRTGEVIGAKWDEFDLDADVPTWTIPRDRMKIKLDKDGNPRPDQVLYLSTQAIALLQQMREAADVKATFVFPGRPGEDRRAAHVTDNAISQAMRRDLAMDGKHVPHGWRAALKTLATAAEKEDGSPCFAPEWSEVVLDHVTGDGTTQAYLRVAPKMRAGAGRVMQWWADELTAS